MAEISDSIAPLLKRAFLFLEDEEWNRADEYFEKVLDLDPENAQGYLGKLMAEFCVKKQEDLKDCPDPIDESDNFEKAIRFSDEELKAALTDYAKHIRTRNQNARLEEIYNRAKTEMLSAETEQEYKRAANFFATIHNYKDAAVLMQECQNNAEEARKDAILAEGKAKMSWGSVADYKAAIELFETILGWKDAEKAISDCKNAIQKIKATEEAERIEQEQLKKKKERRNKRIAILSIPIICAVVVFVVVLMTIVVPSVKYNNAIEQIEMEKIVEAYETLISLGNYKDSAEIANSIYEKYLHEKVKSAKVGDYIFFGQYEQDNDTSNGKESIEWIVLEIKNNKAFVVSRYALDSRSYNEKFENMTWEKCTLRKWLNNDFINVAFSKEERSMIPTVTVSPHKNSSYTTNPGNATQDKVFLLSALEASKYLGTDELKCYPTEYTSSKGVSFGAYSDNSCVWWLRSTGQYQNCASQVFADGVIYDRGEGVSYDNRGVRPAMWIDLNG